MSCAPRCAYSDVSRQGEDIRQQFMASTWPSAASTGPRALKRPAFHARSALTGSANRPRCARTAQTTMPNQRPPTRVLSSSWRPFPHSLQTGPAPRQRRPRSPFPATIGPPAHGAALRRAGCALARSPLHRALRHAVPIRHVCSRRTMATVAASPVLKDPRRRRRVSSRGSDRPPSLWVAVILLTASSGGFTAGQRGCPVGDHTCGRCSSI